MCVCVWTCLCSIAYTFVVSSFGVYNVYVINCVFFLPFFFFPADNKRRICSRNDTTRTCPVSTPHRRLLYVKSYPGGGLIKLYCETIVSELKWTGGRALKKVSSTFYLYTIIIYHNYLDVYTWKSNKCYHLTIIQCTDLPTRKTAFY